MALQVAHDILVRANFPSHSSVLDLRGDNAGEVYTVCTQLSALTSLDVTAEVSDDLENWSTVGAAPLISHTSAPSHGYQVLRPGLGTGLRARFLRLRFDVVPLNGGSLVGQLSAWLSRKRLT